MKPIILITHKYYENNSVAGIKRGYGEMTDAAGGMPFVDAMGDIDDYADGCDGILFTGGCDIEPARYGMANTVDFNRELDEREFALFEAFYKRGKPIFGICRGMQLINAALGGTLFTDIGTAHSGGAVHSVQIKQGTLLNELFGDEAEVNSFHHQAADICAPGLVASAYSPDGIIEAVEHKTMPVFGVQWHPERTESGIRLFGHFVLICKKIKTRIKL